MVTLSSIVINGVVEEGLCGRGRNVTVLRLRIRHFLGAPTDDLSHHIIPLFQKKPSHFIVHDGKNDTCRSASRKILNILLNFKTLIQERLPDCNVYILTPKLRSDNRKVTFTVNQLINHLLPINIDIVDNRNITSKHLSQNVLHLNESGSQLLAIIFLERVQNFYLQKVLTYKTY